MSDIDVFVIEDDFDPLADLELGVDEEQPATDYLPPIPDAELSRVPDRAPLPPAKHREAARGHSRPAIPHFACRRML